MILVWDDHRLVDLMREGGLQDFAIISPEASLAEMERRNPTGLVADLRRFPPDRGARLHATASQIGCCLIAAGSECAADAIRCEGASFDVLVDIAWPAQLLVHCVRRAAAHTENLGGFLEIQTWLAESAVREVESYRELAEKDGLTGLWNRRAFDFILPKEHRRAARVGCPYAVVFIDLDDLRALNASHGHPAGSAALQLLGGVLLGMTRKGHYAFRYGGDEMVSLLMNVDKRGAGIYAHRLLEDLRRIPLSHEGRVLHVRASAGVAEFPTDGQGHAEVLAAADAALFQAKGAGKDRVVVHGEHPVEAGPSPGAGPA